MKNWEEKEIYDALTWRLRRNENLTVWKEDEIMMLKKHRKRFTEKTKKRIFKHHFLSFILWTQRGQHVDTKNRYVCPHCDTMCTHQKSRL